MPLIGEVDITIHTYRALVERRASFIPFYCKMAGIVMAMIGLAALIWSDGYLLVTGVLILAGALVYLAVPPAILTWMVKRHFPAMAGVWRYELDDDGVTWAMPSLRTTAGWPRVATLDDHPDALFLILSGRIGMVPLLKSAFREADRESLLGFCRERAGLNRVAP